jgi:phosphoglycolate phosphatase
MRDLPKSIICVNYRCVLGVFYMAAVLPNEAKGHIVFDCDGTLISSMQAVFKAIQQFMSEYLEREVTPEEVKSKYTADMMALCQNFGLDIGAEDQQQKMFKRWTEIAAANEHQYDLFDGIKDLVHDLSESGYCLYVWTLRDRRSTLEILKQLGIIGHFFDFRCMDDTTPKPHPQGLEELVGGFAKDNIVVIGDTAADIEGANNFGCKSIAALWCENINEAYIEKAGPSFNAKVPHECIKIIEENIAK